MLRSYFKHLGISLITYFLLAGIFLLYLLFKGNLNFLDGQHLMRFDAQLYEDIKNNGYHADWLCAFFPAFPCLWKLLHASEPGIAVINALIFIACSSALAALYKANWKWQLFVCLIPSFVFMFVPYTEALFFAAATLLIIGLKSDKLALILSGLLLASFVRPTTVVFIPAIIGVYFLANHDLKRTVLQSSLPVLVLALGLAITVIIHFYFTHIWFVFFKAQERWQNHLHLPKLPFRSWGGDSIARLDGSALALGLTCGAYCLDALYKKFKTGLILPHKDLTFSVLYMFGTVLLVLAYRDGDLYSINRFIYATAFIVVILYRFFQSYQFKWKHVWLLVIISELFWLLFNSYNHIHNLLLFSMVSFYFLLLLLTRHPNKVVANISIFLLIALNCIGFIKLFYRYLNGGWIA